MQNLGPIGRDLVGFGIGYRSLKFINFGLEGDSCYCCSLMYFEGSTNFV